ncbi:MAG TPA: hypothetical protein VFN35_15025 [Ktedonobacteraceae bacterium]|nr:hypothetical protein [Ktedonobacteraceae bacterium]
MSQLQVTYEPTPISWVIPRDAHGVQRGIGTAQVTLTVNAVDASTGEQVSGVVTSVLAPDPDGLIDDFNDLNFSTNRPQAVTLYQTVSHEVASHPVYDYPRVQVTVCGYDHDLFILR